MIKKIMLGLAAMIVGGGGYFAWKLRPQVDEIPEVLEEIAEEIDHLAVTFRAQGPEPELTLRDLKGKTAFFVIQGKESMQAGEGIKLSRALNRWQYPQTVQGYWIGDAEGMGLFAAKVEEMFVGGFRHESQWPIYLDFDGAMLSTFNLPKGHTGFVILGPDGEILQRHSGDPDGAKLEEIRGLLGGENPPPPRNAPEFLFQDFDVGSCSEAGCIFVFLAGPVALADMPMMEGGFESEEMSDMWEQGRKPDVRNIGQVMGNWQLEGTGIRALVVGKVEGLEAEGVTLVDTAPDLRAAFGVQEDESAVAIVKDGKLSFFEKETIVMWKYGQAGDILGIEARDPRAHGDDDGDTE